MIQNREWNRHKVPCLASFSTLRANSLEVSILYDYLSLAVYDP